MRVRLKQIGINNIFDSRFCVCLLRRLDNNLSQKMQRNHNSSKQAKLPMGQPLRHAQSFNVDMNIRILNITTAPQSMGFFRGSTSFLQKRGFDVAMCSSPGEHLQQAADSENAMAFFVPMTRAITPWSDLKSLCGLYRVMKRYRPSIVNASTPKAGLLGMVAAKLAGVPVRVFQQRGLRLETTTGLRRFILWCTEKITCACAHRIICNSESIRQSLKDLHLASLAKTTVLCQGSSRGVDADHFRINDDSISLSHTFQKKNHFPSQVPVIGFIGRIVKDKGVDELITVFKNVLDRHPDSLLIFIGPEESGDPVDREKLEWLKQNPNIILTGKIDDVVPYYNLFDVFVFPSYREGFPNVVLEAAAMGIPTVGFGVTGVRDAVVDGETGTLVPLKDADAMTDAVLNYLKRPEFRFQHALQGRKRVIRDFQPPMLWEAYYQEYCDLLRSKKMEIPKPEVPPLSPELIDADKDEQEFRKWYAVREILLKNGDLTETCQITEVNQTDLEQMIHSIQGG